MVIKDVKVEVLPPGHAQPLVIVAGGRYVIFPEYEPQRIAFAISIFDHPDTSLLWSRLSLQLLLSHFNQPPHVVFYCNIPDRAVVEDAALARAQRPPHYNMGGD